ATLVPADGTLIADAERQPIPVAFVEPEDEPGELHGEGVAGLVAAPGRLELLLTELLVSGLEATAVSFLPLRVGRRAARVPFTFRQGTALSIATDLDDLLLEALERDGIGTPLLDVEGQALALL